MSLVDPRHIPYQPFLNSRFRFSIERGSFGVEICGRDLDNLEIREHIPFGALAVPSPEPVLDPALKLFPHFTSQNEVDGRPHHGIQLGFDRDWGEEKMYVEFLEVGGARNR